ncbi:MAG: cytochrome C biogenesis protein CcdA [Candidatus Omnitrophica bacterium CG23_combo_of_CG06-09_8_20_14_all_40_11]|nr:MAG: cytochrome C biogenesis protein CcdA [Candidatus Omnitrophica bacterium CG23_combo_of_CG06-09_8_20_14_all_40_11]
MNVVIFVTAANKKEAEKVASALIKEKLAACVNIIENLHSMFWWQGKVNRLKEVLLIVKSKKTLMNKLIKKIKSLHSYAVPEIIALPIVAGDKKYLKWINESTR